MIIPRRCSSGTGFQDTLMLLNDNDIAVKFSGGAVGSETKKHFIRSCVAMIFIQPRSQGFSVKTGKNPGNEALSMHCFHRRHRAGYTGVSLKRHGRHVSVAVIKKNSCHSILSHTFSLLFAQKRRTNKQTINDCHSRWTRE